MPHETFEFTKQKIRENRRSRIRQLVVVVGAAAVGGTVAMLTTDDAARAAIAASFVGVMAAYVVNILT